MVISQAEQSEQYDIIIVGAGVVGSLIGRLLAERAEFAKLRWAIIAPKQEQPDRAAPEQRFDQARRVSAINESLDQHLAALLPQYARLQREPMRLMTVASEEFGGSFQLDANRFDRRALARVVYNTQLADTLNGALQANRIDAQVQQVSADAHGYQLQADHKHYRTRLLVAADGAQSKIVSQLLLSKQDLPLNLRALGAQIELEFEPQAFTGSQSAYQWFGRDGSIFGLLPLQWYGDNRGLFSLVWSLPTIASPTQAIRNTVGIGARFVEKGQDLQPARRLNQLFQGSALPIRAKQVSEQSVWPVRRHLLNWRQLKQHCGLFVVGDAAHSIHPLAGQGLNLGIKDALCWIEMLNDWIDQNGQLRQFSPAMHSAAAQFHRLVHSRAQAMLLSCEGLRAIAQPRRSGQFLLSLALNQFHRHQIFQTKVVNSLSFEPFDQYLQDRFR